MCNVIPASPVAWHPRHSERIIKLKGPADKAAAVEVGGYLGFDGNVEEISSDAFRKRLRMEMGVDRIAELINSRANQIRTFTSRGQMPPSFKEFLTRRNGKHRNK